MSLLEQYEIELLIETVIDLNRHTFREREGEREPCFQRHV